MVCVSIRWANFSSIPVYYLPRQRASNVDRFDERKWLYFGKSKKQTITGADYADDIVLQSNTPA